MTTGNKIKNIRKEKNITQAKLAKIAGISEISIRKYEAGERFPKLDTVRKIAVALDVTMSDLIDDWSQFSPEELQKDWNSSEANNKTSRVCNLFKALNDIGQDKAIDQVELLTKIPEYRKDSK